MVLGSQGDIYGPGGQGVMYDEQLKTPIMYYHYMRRTTGYHVKQVYFGWNRLSFDSGWPVALGKELPGSKDTKPNSSVSLRLGPSDMLSLLAMLLVGVLLLC